jgi:hypothetical protein
MPITTSEDLSSISRSSAAASFTSTKSFCNSNFRLETGSGFEQVMQLKTESDIPGEPILKAPLLPSNLTHQKKLVHINRIINNIIHLLPSILKILLRLFIISHATVLFLQQRFQRRHHSFATVITTIHISTQIRCLRVHWHHGT